MKFPILLLTSCLASTAAIAGIGDTPEQIEALYGAPQVQHQDTNDRQAATLATTGRIWHDYESHGLKILVDFHNNKSIGESYQKADGQPLTDKEILAILKTCSTVSQWNEDRQPSGGTNRFWTSNDRTMIASWSVAGNQLNISKTDEQ